MWIIKQFIPLNAPIYWPSFFTSLLFRLRFRAIFFFFLYLASTSHFLISLPFHCNHLAKTTVLEESCYLLFLYPQRYHKRVDWFHYKFTTTKLKEAFCTALQPPDTLGSLAFPTSVSTVSNLHFLKFSHLGFSNSCQSLNLPSRWSGCPLYRKNRSHRLECVSLPNWG